MNQNRSVSFTSILNVLLAVAVVIALRGFYLDAKNTVKYGGVDLRNRVVGARLMMDGQDPYTFKWSEEYPDMLLDPIDNPQNEVSRVTVPPTVLMLHMSMANLSYHSQRIIWLLLQWILLLLSVWFFAKCANSKHIAKMIWIVGLFFAGTYIWRFHVERGQIYILFVFLVALSFWISRKPLVYASFLGGLMLGLAVGMRPTWILISLPMLVFRKWRLLAGMVAGALVLVLLSAAVFGVPAWKSYGKAMRYHEKDNLFLAQPVSLGQYDRPIEGMDNLQDFLSFPEVNTSAQWVFKSLFDLDLTSDVLLVMLGVVLLLMTAGLFLFRGKSVSLATVFLVGSVMALVSEYFLPAIKAYYGNIMWLIPLELILLNPGMLTSLGRRQRSIALFLLLTGLFFSYSILWGNYEALIGEGLISMFFVWMSACFLMLSPPREQAGGE